MTGLKLGVQALLLDQKHNARISSCRVFNEHFQLIMGGCFSVKFIANWNESNKRGQNSKLIQHQPITGMHNEVKYAYCSSVAESMQDGDFWKVNEYQIPSHSAVMIVCGKLNNVVLSVNRPQAYSDFAWHQSDFTAQTFLIHVFYSHCIIVIIV